MKKYIFSLFVVLILSFLITPNVSLAQSTSPTDTDPNPPASCVSIQNNLRYRDRDSAKSGEVSTLQDFLQSKGYLNSEPTGYMGLLTFQAVKDYQKSKGISPTGYVGPSTRAVIAADCGGGNPDPVLPPSLDGCLPGYKYSSTTGKPCDDTATVTPVTSSIYDTFAQCLASKNLTLYSASWCPHCQAQKALFGDSFKYLSYVECSNSTSNFYQNKMCVDKNIIGYPTWIDKDGTKYEGEQSLEKLSQISNCALPTATTNNDPVISGVSGPQTLDVGQQGTWTVNASNPNGGILSYSVDWGDTPIPPCSSSGVICSTAAQVQIQQSATFNHTYTTAGTYVPVFTVTNSSGQSAKTSLSVKVGNVENIPSLTVSLDSSTPIAQTITAGRGNVIFARIKITAGSQNVSNLNAIQIGSDLSNSVKLNNIRVYENDTQIGTTNYSLSYNGSYYQSWVYLKGAFIIPANTSKILSIMADTSPSGSGLFFTGNVRLGIAGWNFDSPGARVSPSGTAIYGNEFNVVSSTDDIPVISGVSGPQTLDVGQQGTWTVNASNPNGGILSYSVDWGDTPIPPCSSSGVTCSTAAQVQIQQSATFNHTYTTAGTYVPVFTVTNSSGQSAKTSLSVKVGNVTTPSITVLSPNGGENLKDGDVVRITWKTTSLPSSQKLDIALEVPHLTWQNGTVGKNIITGIDNRGFYDWTVKALQPFYEPEGGTIVYPNGQYKINVSCRSGDGVCPISNNFDESDNYFTITSSSVSIPTISSVSGPQTLTVGQQGTWTVNASDKNEGTLTYSVDWGDAATRSGCTGACATNSILSSQQSATFTHTYTTAGTYTATFKVTNSSGQSVGTSISVNVIGKTTPTEVLSNPVLNTSMSTRSQNVPVGSNGANDIVRATYDLSAGNSDVSISEIKYLALGSTPNPIASIRVGSVSAPVICYMGATCSAYLTSLNIVIPANTTKSIDAYISYGAVGVNGVPSGSTAQVQMTYVKYSYNSISTSMNTNSEPSPLMTLVSNSTPTNSNPVLGLIAVPAGINAGQAVNFDFSATDADNDNLSWTVDWGESPYMVGACSITNSQQKQGWTWSGSHTWNKAGTYNARVTVSDCKGGEASKSFYVTVTNPQPYMQVLYPKGGESVQSGSTLRIQWRATGITSNANSIAVQVFKANATSDYYGVAPVFGVTWSNTVEGSVISDTGFYDWVIPSAFSAGQYVVMVGGGPYGLKAYGEPFSIISSSTPGGGTGVGTRTPVAGVSLSSNALNALGDATSVESQPQSQIETNVSSSCTAFTKILAKGMNSEEVRCLQKKLNEKGFKVEGLEFGKETSYFGYATLMALKKFQTANGLKADGVFGTASSTALLK